MDNKTWQLSFVGYICQTQLLMKSSTFHCRFTCFKYNALQTWMVTIKFLNAILIINHFFSHCEVKREVVLSELNMVPLSCCSSSLNILEKNADMQSEILSFLFTHWQLNQIIKPKRPVREWCVLVHQTTAVKSSHNHSTGFTSHVMSLKFYTPEYSSTGQAKSYKWGEKIRKHGQIFGL